MRLLGAEGLRSLEAQGQVLAVRCRIYMIFGEVYDGIIGCGWDSDSCIIA